MPKKSKKKRSKKHHVSGIFSSAIKSVKKAFGKGKSSKKHLNEDQTCSIYAINNSSDIFLSESDKGSHFEMPSSKICKEHKRSINIIGLLEESLVWVEEEPIKLPKFLPKNLLGFPLDESNEIEETELLEIFPECSTDIKKENFSPAMYLIKFHKNSTISELMKGLSYLQYKLAEQEAATISQNAANLNLMISIINALSNLFTEMEHEAKSDNWPLTKNLSSMINELKLLMTDELNC